RSFACGTRRTSHKVWPGPRPYSRIGDPSLAQHGKIFPPVAERRPETIRFSAVRQYCRYSKHQPRRMDMRFISICTVNSTSRLPTEAEMASMHKLIVEGMKAGWLLECEGVSFGTTGVRVHKAADGKITVTDGPFAETK